MQSVLHARMCLLVLVAIVLIDNLEIMTDGDFNDWGSVGRESRADMFLEVA